MCTPSPSTIRPQAKAKSAAASREGKHRSWAILCSGNTWFCAQKDRRGQGANGVVCQGQQAAPQIRKRKKKEKEQKKADKQQRKQETKESRMERKEKKKKNDLRVCMCVCVCVCVREKVRESVHV